MRARKRQKPTAGTVSFQENVGVETSFSLIIAHFAERAKAAGLDAGRVGRAVELVLHPDIHEICWVWSKADPLTLNVRSQRDPDNKWYRVNGQCECVDYQRRGGPCKHRIARWLIMRAEEVLDG